MIVAKVIEKIWEEHNKAVKFAKAAETVIELNMS